MRLERKLTVGVLALALPAAAALVTAALVGRGEPWLWPALAIWLAVTMLAVGAAALWRGRSLLRVLAAVQRGAELIGTVNPAHRLDVATGDEVQALAIEINRIAGQLRAARQGRDEAVAAATRELEAERRRLVEIFEALPHGVVVAAPDGRITLANHAGARLLSGGHPLLGRGLGDLVDRGLIEGPVAAVLGDGETARFSMPTPGGVLDVTMSALAAEDGRPGAIVLALRPAEDAAPGAAAADPVDRFAGAGLRSGVAAAEPGPLRSELYDFSLFDEMEAGLSTAARDRRLEDLTFVVFDTETTGLHPESGDRVVSLAGVRVRGGRVRREEVFDALVQPGRWIPPESVRIHGITDAMVADAPLIDRVLPAFLRFAGDGVLVGHEASFDLRFLAPAARRLGLPRLEARPILDTRLLSRSLHGPGESHHLEVIAQRLGVPVVGRHSALGDALTTAEVLVRFLVLLDKRGVHTLGAAVDAIRGTRSLAV